MSDPAPNAPNASGADDAATRAAGEPAEASPATPGVGSFALLGALTSAASIGTSIVRSKVTARVLGPAGLGVTSEVNQLVALLTSVAAVAAGPVLIAWVSTAHRQGDRAKVRHGVASATTLGLLVALVGGVLATLLAPWLLPARTPWLRGFTLLAALSTASATLAGVYQGGFVATADLRAATLSTLATTLASGACVVGLTLAFGLPGLFSALALGNALGLLVALALARPRGLAAPPAWHAPYVRHALAIGATTLVAAVLTQLSTASMYAALARAGGAAHGAEYNGNYQAASQIGTQYFSVILSGLSSYYFPRYAAAKGPDELLREVHDAAGFVLRLAPPVVIAAIALRGPLIGLLYSHRFDLAVAILGYQLAGDLPKAVAWAYAGPLVFRGELRAFLFTEGVGTALSIAASFTLVGALGPVGAGLASTCTSALYALVTVAVLARVCNAAPRWGHALRAIGLALACLGLELATRRWPSVRWAALCVSAVWLLRLGAVGYLRQRFARVLRKLRR